MIGEKSIKNILKKSKEIGSKENKVIPNKFYPVEFFVGGNL